MAEPLSIRNNNPGNIEFGPFAARHGGTGDGGRFARFPDMDTGFAAMQSLLDVYDKQHGINTIRGVIGRWAPESDNNPTGAYVDFVARAVGADPDKPLTPEQRAALPAAMAHFEAGKPVGAATPQKPQEAAASPPSMVPQLAGETPPVTQSGAQARSGGAGMQFTELSPLPAIPQMVPPKLRRVALQRLPTSPLGLRG